MTTAPQHYEGEAWNYPARPDPTSIHSHGVVDGDTFDLWMRVSPNSIETTRVRFLHISTAEIRFVPKDSEEYRNGIEHYHHVLEWMSDAVERANANGINWPLFARTSWMVGMRGRFLADIYDYESNSLAESLYNEFGDEVLSPETWHPREPQNSAVNVPDPDADDMGVDDAEDAADDFLE